MYVTGILHTARISTVEWFLMILNEKKTKVMLTTAKWLDKKQEQQQLQLKLNASKLEQVTSQN